VPAQAQLGDEADGEDQAQGEGDGGDVRLIAQPRGARALEPGQVAVAEDVKLGLQEGHEGRGRRPEDEGDHAGLHACRAVQQLAKHPLQHEEHEDGVEDHLQRRRPRDRLRGRDDAGEDPDERAEVPGGRGRGLRGRTPAEQQERRCEQEEEIAQVEGAPHPVAQQGQEHEADVDEAARHHHEEVVPGPRPHSVHETETATGSFAYGDTDIGGRGARRAAAPRSATDERSSRD
jgi:hypothetical protein